MITKFEGPQHLTLAEQARFKPQYIRQFETEARRDHVARARLIFLFFQRSP